jgi:predicted alpha/beta superfamily hydrolase
MRAACLFAVLAAAAACVPVTVMYPDDQLHGQSLYLRGDGGGLSWDKGVEMDHTGTDQWSVCVSAGNIQVKPLISDTNWANGANSYIPAGGSFVYPWFYRTNGEYTYVYGVFSPQLNNTRDLVVYVPPSYDENPYKHYGDVLIMHDGQNLFNASTSFAGVAWDVQDAADTLIMEGTTTEYIIVGVDNTPERIYEYTYSQDPSTPGGGGADLYLEFLEATVLPIVTSSFRIDTGNLQLGMMGSSLGGLVTCYAGWTRPSMYGKLGCMSSSFWWNNQDFNTTVMSTAQPPQTSLFYMDSGNVGSGEQEINADTVIVYDHFIADGFQPGSNLFHYVDPNGQHDEASWGARVHIPLSVMYAVSYGV